MHLYKICCIYLKKTHTYIYVYIFVNYDLLSLINYFFIVLTDHKILYFEEKYNLNYTDVKTKFYFSNNDFIFIF